MSEAKFTPGPWGIDAGFNSSKPEDFDEYWQVHDGQDAIACSSGCYAGNQEANARLIAAAPDLYEALDRIQGIIEAAFPALNNGEALCNARIALAKARGEA